MARFGDIILTVATLSAFLATALSAQDGSENFFKDRPVGLHEYAPAMIELVIPHEGAIMTGLYYSAQGQGPHPTIILLHAFPGFEQNLDMAQALRRQGYNILFFHYRGTWGSGGAFSWNNSASDVHAAINYLRQPANTQKLRVDTDQIILIGHSWGGMLSLAVGSVRSDISCIGSIAPEDWTQWLGTEADRKSVTDYLDGIHSVNGYPSAKALEDLMSDQDKWSLTTIAQNIGDKKLLLISGEWDDGFASDMRVKIANLAQKNGTKDITSFTIKAADHSFSAKRIELIERTGAWLNDTCKTAE